MRTKPAGRPWVHGVEVATRTAVTLGIVLVALACAGRLDLASYGMFGAFCAVYGFNEPYRVRARTVGVAGAGILVAIVAGILLSATAAPLAVTGVVTLLVLVGGVVVNTMMGLVPAPPFFDVIALLICAAIPTPPGEVGLRAGVAAAATVLAWLLSLSGWVVRRAWPGHAETSSRVFRPFFKDLSRVPVVDRTVLRDPLVWRAVAENVAGAALAYAIGVALGGAHPYWAVLTVVCVIAPARARPSAAHAIERVIGTAVGLGVVWLLEPLRLQAAPIIVIMVVCQFFTQLFVVNTYALALVFITVMVFMSMSFIMPITGPLLLERLAETAIGSGVGLLLMTPDWFRARLRRA
ncbi:FUSC family protein [Nonomuraea spiralis]|uniref:FUSC family protein n=1 Tax=Nonomuraea spiralis TaxID=46182 RepID=UPI00379787A4